MKRFRAFLASTSGAVAAEFVLVIPVMLVMIFGSINGALMVYSYVQLHYAAGDAARCRAIKAVCFDDASTESYAESKLSAPLASVSFAHSTAGCGNTVTATATYNFTTGLTNTPITMQAQSCYPLQP